MQNFKMKEIERHTVSFSKKNEEDLYKFCCENSTNKGKKFATYVKEILREKMEQKNESIESIIDKRIEEYFKNKNVKVEDKEEAMSKYDDTDKAALLGFLKKK